MSEEVVIGQGVEIDFLNGIENIAHGIVNGPIVVAFQDGKTTTWVPVYCTTPETSGILIVNAENITGARTYSVRV